MYVASGSKSSDFPYTGAWLSTIGAPDTILYWAYGTTDGGLLTSWSVTEDSAPHGISYGMGGYLSGVSSYGGKGVKVISRARDFSWGSFPIQTDINFH